MEDKIEQPLMPDVANVCNKTLPPKQWLLKLHEKVYGKDYARSSNKLNTELFKTSMENKAFKIFLQASWAEHKTKHPDLEINLTDFMTIAQSKWHEFGEKEKKTFFEKVRRKPLPGVPMFARKMVSNCHPPANGSIENEPPKLDQAFGDIGIKIDDLPKKRTISSKKQFFREMLPNSESEINKSIDLVTKAGGNTFKNLYSKTTLNVETELDSNKYSASKTDPSLNELYSETMINSNFELNKSVDLVIGKMCNINSLIEGVDYDKKCSKNNNVKTIGIIDKPKSANHNNDYDTKQFISTLIGMVVNEACDSSSSKEDCHADNPLESTPTHNTATEINFDKHDFSAQDIGLIIEGPVELRTNKVQHVETKVTPTSSSKEHSFVNNAIKSKSSNHRTNVTNFEKDDLSKQDIDLNIQRHGESTIINVLNKETKLTSELRRCKSQTLPKKKRKNEIYSNMDKLKLKSNAFNDITTERLKNETMLENKENESVDSRNKIDLSQIQHVVHSSENYCSSKTDHFLHEEIELKTEKMEVPRRELRKCKSQVISYNHSTLSLINQNIQNEIFSKSPKPEKANLMAKFNEKKAENTEKEKLENKNEVNSTSICKAIAPKTRQKFRPPQFIRKPK